MTRLHTRVAAVTAAVLAVALATVIVGSWFRTRDVLSLATERRAAALASSGAVALSAAGQVDPAAARLWAERVMEVTGDLAFVVVRDEAGAAVIDVAAPGYEDAERRARTGRATVQLPAPATGSFEVGLDRAWARSLAASVTARASLLALLILAAAVALAALATRRIVAPVSRLAGVAAQLARGDLRVSLPPGGAGEIGALSGSMAELTSGLRRTIADLQAAAEELAAKARAVSDTARAQLSTARAQSAAMEQAGHEVQEVSKGSRQAAETAEHVIEVSGRSVALWRDGEKAIADGLAGLAELEEDVSAIALAVTQLSERTVEIGGSAGALRDLAEQSNVLALNAAIEASKVGEEGRGFTVVAAEMRKLAEASRRSAEQVRGALIELQRTTRQVVSATGEGNARAQRATAGSQRASETVAALASAIEDSARAAQGIAESSRRQTGEMDRIAATVEFLQGQTEGTLEGASRMEAVAADLQAVSARLGALVAGYQR